MELKVVAILFPVVLLFSSSHTGVSAGALTTPKLLSKIKSQLEVRKRVGSIFTVKDVTWLLKRIGMKDCKDIAHGTEKCILVSVN